MQFPLAPVETPANDRAALPLEVLELDPERLQAPNAGAECIPAVLPLHDAACFERSCHGYAEPAREVVVARAGLAEELASGRLTERSRLRLGRHDCQRLDRVGDSRVAEDRKSTRLNSSHSQ